MKNLTYIFHITFILFFCSIQPILAQSHSINLDQKIKIEASNVTISELLRTVGAETNIKFAYNPKLIDVKKRITMMGNNLSVSQILDKVCLSKYEYKIRGHYVIITQVDLSRKVNSSSELSGYIIDEETGSGVYGVSLYSTKGSNTVSDQTGSFSIKLKPEEKIIHLKKNGYESISIQVSQLESEGIKIGLVAIKSISVRLNRDSISQKTINPARIKKLETMYPINSDIQFNQENIQDTFFMPVSFSLYPGIATRGNLSSHTGYNFALNFVGYNRGINGVEVGLLSNITHEDVRGIQVAGLGNYVGHDGEGVQVAGLFNNVGNTLNGVQVAGIYNGNNNGGRGIQVGGIYNMSGGQFYGLQVGGIANLCDTISGIQVAGLININDQTDGIQFAGLGNHTHNTEGIQVAGLYNITDTIDGIQFSGIVNYTKEIDGLQVAGLYNMADTIDGLQFSGVMNYTKKIDGLQIAGVSNFADTLDGLQLSGIYNHAKYVKGVQLGLFNVVDSIDGVPIGLFSFVKKNRYLKLELSSDEIFPINFGFTTGVKEFHTKLFGGVQSDIQDNDEALYTFGYGIGSTQDLTSFLAIDFDLSAQKITKKSFISEDSFILKGYMGLDISLFKGLSIAGGVTYNAMYLDSSLIDDGTFIGLRDKYINTYETDNNNSWRQWIGYKVGLRLSI